jgi:hypothetical protein
VNPHPDQQQTDPGEAWVDGIKATLADAIAVLRREVVRARRVVIIAADDLRAPCSGDGTAVWGQR